MDEVLLGVAVPGPAPCDGVHRWERLAFRGGCQCGSPHCAEPVERVLECAGCDATLRPADPWFEAAWEMAPWA